MPLFGRMRARQALGRAAQARLLGQRDEAVVLTERALALDPSLEPAQVLLAELLPRGNDRAGAIERLTGLVDAGARAALVRLRLAACLIDEDRCEEALERLASLPEDVAVQDQLQALQLRAAALARRRRWAEVVEVLESLRALDAGHPVLNDLARALEEVGDVERAQPIRRELARFRPDDWYRFLRALPRPRAEAAAAALGASLERLLELPALDVLARLDEPQRIEVMEGLPEPWQVALHRMALRAAGRSDEARARSSEHADHPVVRFESALVSMCADTIERSVELLEQLYEEGHALPGLPYWRAVAHHAAGDDRRAATLYRALLDDEPEHGHAWWLLADVLLRLEGEAARREAERRAFQATPLLLARLLRSQLVDIVGVAGRARMGRLEDDDPALVSACTCAGDGERASELLRRWAGREGLDDGTRLLLAREGLSAPAHDAVMRLLEPLVAAEHPEALAIVGESLAVAGKPVLAAERLRRATALDASLTRAWDFLGVLLAQRKEWNEAEPALRMAVKLGPEGPERHRNLAALLLDTGRGAEAVASAERAVAMLESDGGTLRMLARAYDAAGDGQWAVLAAWASDHHVEQRLHRAALGGLATVLPGNVRPHPDVFRPTFGRFLRRLEEIAGMV